MSIERDEAIRRRAFEIWESEERPHGEDIRHWMEAEDELRADELAREVSAYPQEVDKMPAGADEERGQASASDSASSDSTKTPDVKITTGERPVEMSIKETEGP